MSQAFTSYFAGNLTLAVMSVVLIMSVWRDVRHHRIDNWITFPAALAAVGLYGVAGGVSGGLFALGGLAVGLLLMLPLHVLGGMAAGDVKLMAAAGAFLGPAGAALGVLFSLIAGTLLALAYLLARGRLRSGLQQTGEQLWLSSMTGVWVAAAPGSPTAERFPYALAILAGCLAAAGLRPAGWVTGFTY